MSAKSKPDKNGRVPALEYARISLARDLIRDRKAVGLSQQKLAALAGIRQETLSRIETGKHTAPRKPSARSCELSKPGKSVKADNAIQRPLGVCSRTAMETGK